MHGYIYAVLKCKNVIHNVPTTAIVYQLVTILLIQMIRYMSACVCVCVCVLFNRSNGLLVNNPYLMFVLINTLMEIQA